jgi:hypothetical protein
MISSDLHFEYLVFVLWSLILDFFFKPNFFVTHIVCLFVELNIILFVLFMIFCMQILLLNFWAWILST